MNRVISIISCFCKVLHVKLNNYLKFCNCGNNLRNHLKSTKTAAGWLGNRIMCPSGATFLSADCCLSELAL